MRFRVLSRKRTMVVQNNHFRLNMPTDTSIQEMTLPLLLQAVTASQSIPH